jgi:hypothetical protein
MEMLRQSIMTDPKFNPTRPMGHLSGAGATAPENELQNREISPFLDLVADKGRKTP